MRTGINAKTGKILTGWDHCVQSIGKCLTTRFKSRALRRYLGSDVPEIQDANANPMTIFSLYQSIAEALNDELGGEPGFSLQGIEMVEYGRSGRFAFILSGLWFPRGHLGDWSISENVSLQWPDIG
ncbi:baseplate assembly protein [Paenochrobactrum glaciei]|uniref:Baseplate assembly protein n=1 Tax=Paenochrobactrum glaciei TaxID=486407 RepID=A0ABN1FXX0_9HYPH